MNHIYVYGGGLEFDNRLKLNKMFELSLSSAQLVNYDYIYGNLKGN